MDSLNKTSQWILSHFSDREPNINNSSKNHQYIIYFITFILGNCRQAKDILEILLPPTTCTQELKCISDRQLKNWSE